MHHLKSLTSLVTDPSPTHLVVLAVIVIVAACVVWLLSHTAVTGVFAIGIAAEAFSGNWKYIPLPVPLDRVILLLGVTMLLLKGAGSCSDRRIILRPVHFLLFGVAVYAALSAFWAGSLGSSYGFYSLLDRLGFIPFIMFALAPLLFGNRRQRNTLLVAMVVLGLYLGVTGILEETGPHALVLPRFIENDAIGITQSRVRGPYLGSDAMGLMLFDCAVFAAIALTEWTDRRARFCCWAVIGMAPLGIFFTLTRSVWLGSVIGTVLVMALVPRLRRRLPVVALVGVMMVVGALLFVPGLSSNASGRVNTESSVWDRYNTNNAAIRIIEAHPLFGVGWQEFQTVNWKYLREAATYPLGESSTDIEVHNVFLSHFAELGLVGGLLWCLALVTAVGGGILRRGPPELMVWRLGLLAMFAMFLAVANLGPLSYAQPNLMLWLMAGIVAVPRNSEMRNPELLDEFDVDLVDLLGRASEFEAV